MLLKHVLRNSVISTVTLMSLCIGVLLSGTVVVENVFSIPGLGSLLVNSVTARDYPVVQALTLLFGFAVVLVSLADRHALRRHRPAGAAVSARSHVHGQPPTLRRRARRARRGARRAGGG